MASSTASALAVRCKSVFEPSFGKLAGAGTRPFFARAQVWKAPVDGSQGWTNILSCCVTDIAVAGGYVYGIGLDQGLWRAPTDGSQGWTNVASCCITDLAVGESHHVVHRHHLAVLDRRPGGGVAADSRRRTRFPRREGRASGAAKRGPRPADGRHAADLSGGTDAGHVRRSALW